MNAASELEQLLLSVLPPRKVEGPVASHTCEECDELQEKLGAVTWLEVPGGFLEAHDDVLPHLTHDAYLVFLPAWLRQSFRNPNGPAAGMVQVNLRHKPDTRGFSRAQAAAIIETARYISTQSIYGASDPVNVESLMDITRIWTQVAV
jgi:hypothetical protein